MKKVQLEMGGKNPLVVLDDADLDVAVDCAVNGAFFSTGQRCTASSRLIVTEGIHDRFVAGDDRAAAGPGRRRRAQGRHAHRPGGRPEPARPGLDYIEIGQAGGRQARLRRRALNRETEGFYLQPALFTETDNEMRINREEIFGPVASVIRVKDYDEALRVANDTEFGLSAGICTTVAEARHALQAQREAGMVMVNLPTAGVDYHVPFGGRKGSSYGPREQGRYAASSTPR
jgi:alpha-ketoglutaric semialdehyde dehydrogenase